jgi:hypothetical protein
MITRRKLFPLTSKNKAILDAFSSQVRSRFYGESAVLELIYLLATQDYNVASFLERVRIPSRLISKSRLISSF